MLAADVAVRVPQYVLNQHASGVWKYLIVGNEYRFDRVFARSAWGQGIGQVLPDGWNWQGSDPADLTGPLHTVDRHGSG